ncbi:hypothetical protein EV121DRAFT_280673 [Schizophyllum commune]
MRDTIRLPAPFASTVRLRAPLEKAYRQICGSKLTRLQTMKFTLFLALTALAASPAVLAAPTNSDAIHVARSRISLMGQKVSPHPHKDTTIPGNDSSVDAQFAVCGRGFRNCGSKA